MARQSDSGIQISAGISKIASLETALLSKPYNPNPLVQLLDLSRNPAPDVVHKAIWALHRVFLRFISDGRVGGLSDNALRRASGSTGQSAEEAQTDGVEVKEVRSWVRDRLLEYVEVLSGLIRDKEAGLRKSALPLLFALLPPLSANVSEEPTIHIPYFRIILRSLLSPLPSLRGAKPAEEPTTSTSLETPRRWNVIEENQVEDDDGIVPEDVLEVLHEDYWAKYDDLRWAFFREATRYLKSGEEVSGHGSSLLAQLLPLTNLPRLQDDLNTFFVPSLSTPPSSSTPPTKKPRKKSKKAVEPESLPDWMATYESDPSSDEEPGSGKKRQRTSQLSIHASVHSIPSHQTLYSILWETILASVQMDELWTRRVLLALHGKNGILSHMKPERRVRVADWLGALVDQGGARAMLAMNGLFVLMTKFNLDYPNFYQRLYALLDQDVLHVKFRARFFRLLDTFLASPLLPSTLVASFIKRLSSLSLTAPPAGTIMVIPFIYNLFKRHPGCMVMIQRPADNSADEFTDPYNPDDPSPLTSNAMASSCWELVALQNHYLASVSTLAKVFNEVFTKPEFSMEDFLDHGYGTLFETEIKRQIKRPSALSSALEGPQGLVGEAFPGKEADDEVRAAGDIISQLWTF